MSLETLLEAAKYVEYSSDAIARGETPKDFNTYINCLVDSTGPILLVPSSLSTDADNSQSYDECRERRRAGGAGTREVHNKLEKNRRAHLKKCFETLKKQIPNMDDKKTSNLGILRSALRYVQNLKRKERDYEYEKTRLGREKSLLQQRLVSLRKELSNQKTVHLDIGPPVVLMPDDDEDTNSTSTASECGPLSDFEDENISDLLRESSTPLHSLVQEDVKPSVKKVEEAPCLSVAVVTSESDRNKISLLTTTAPSSVIPTVVAATTTLAAPKAVLVQTTPVVNRTIAPHHLLQMTATPMVSAATVGNGIHKVGSTVTIGALQRMPVAPISFPAQVMSHANLNGGAGMLAHSAAVQVLAQPGMRVLTPMTTAAAAGLSMGLGIGPVSAPPTITTQVPSTVCSQTVVNSTVAGSSLSLGKAMPVVPRMTTLAPVQVSTIPSPPSQGTIKGLLATATPQNPIAIAQLTVKPNSLTTLGQQPILTAAAVNFQSATPTAVTSTPMTMSRQMMTAAVKPMGQMAQVRPQLTHLTQVMAPTTIVSSVGQVVSGGTQLSTVMTPVSVVPTLNHATAMAQMIGPSHLGKVVAAPFLKSVYQQQFLPQLSSVSSQPLVKPIVVVTTANVVPTTVTASNPQQQTQVTVPVTR